LKRKKRLAHICNSICMVVINSAHRARHIFSNTTTSVTWGPDNITSVTRGHHPAAILGKIFHLDLIRDFFSRLLDSSYIFIYTYIYIYIYTARYIMLNVIDSFMATIKYLPARLLRFGFFSSSLYAMLLQN
jgi:hypothetical protein